MTPGQFNFNTESSQKAQNYSFASKTPKQPMLTKSDLNWNKRLEKLLNNTDVQDDYYQIYSDASDTTISTICINSSESRYTDSCWSETDATRRDDIVIRLSESVFYNTKVNPFPQLNFPPISSSEKNLSNIVEADQTTEKVAPADATSEIMIDVRNNEGIALAEGVVSGDFQKIENMVSTEVASNEKVEVLSNEDTNLADRVANGGVDVENNMDLAPPQGVEIESEVTGAQNNEVLTSAIEITDLISADGITTEVKGDRSNEACGVGNDLVDDQNKEDFIPTVNVANEAKDDCSHQDIAPPIDDVTKQQSNVGIGAANCVDLVPNVSATEIEYNQVDSMENVPSQKSVESKNLDRKNSILSRRSANESLKSNRKISNEMETTTSASSPPKNYSTLEPRKKRYRKTVDNNHRKNVEHQLSKSSGCTRVTSTTTVQVTTNDDAIFDALADMPDFINSSVIDITSSYIDDRVRLRKNQRTRCIDFGSAFPSSSSSLASSSWRNEKLSSIYDEYISPREAYKQLNTLLRDGTNENLKAVMYDEYNGLRFDDDVASSEDEFLSDVDDLNLTNANWTPPESEIRRQVAIILKKIHPLEDNYCTIINDMLSKYLNYIHSKQRIAKINRIVDCVSKPISQQEKTELLIRKEIDDKKLNREFYHSSIEPPDFTEFGERRRQAIIKKYTRCHNDRKFCYSYFKRSIDDRPVSKLGWRIAKLKQELELIFA